MATLTKQQLALLKLQLQNDSEFKTGLYESEPVYSDYSFEQLFKRKIIIHRFRFI